MTNPNLVPCNIEFHEPNLVVAYAQLAPMVAEAYAYLKSGKQAEMECALERAMQIVSGMGPTATVCMSQQVDRSKWQHSPSKFRVGQAVTVENVTHRMCGHQGIVVWGF